MYPPWDEWVKVDPHSSPFPIHLPCPADMHRAQSQLFQPGHLHSMPLHVPIERSSNMLWEIVHVSDFCTLKTQEANLVEEWSITGL